MTPLDWLLVPQQTLLEATRGQVHADPEGELGQVRALLAWFPPQVHLPHPCAAPVLEQRHPGRTQPLGGGPLLRALPGVEHTADGQVVPTGRRHAQRPTINPVRSLPEGPDHRRRASAPGRASSAAVPGLIIVLCLPTSTTVRYPWSTWSSHDGFMPPAADALPPEPPAVESRAPRGWACRP
jgi:hypothetical protein